MIGSLDTVVIDCPDVSVLADFYAAVLGWEVSERGEDWAEIVPAGGARPALAFQRVDDYRAPEWPGQDLPQQSHLDVRVTDIEAAEQAVLAIGARKADYDQEHFRVYLDPAGHPFCLIFPED